MATTPPSGADGLLAQTQQRRTQMVPGQKKQRLGALAASRIAETIELCFSLNSGRGNRAPIIVATCFWNTSSNTFDFKFGQMGISLLDLLTITGLPIDQEPYRYGDFNETDSSFRFKPSPIWPIRGDYNKSYLAWCNFFSQIDCEQSGITFLELWLCKFLFCTPSLKITGAWTKLATALFNQHRVGLGQTVLASLYRSLYSLSLKPFDYKSVAGPLWILDLWLQVYFPQFRHPDVNSFPEDQLLGMAFVDRAKFDSPSYSACFKYLYNLDESALDTVPLILYRKFPNPLENGFLYNPQHTRRASNAIAQAISCNDLSLSDEEASFEIYAPNHFARQLGFTQAAPYPLFESLNCFTSWRMSKHIERGIEESENRHTIRFTGASYGDIPLNCALKASVHVTACGSVRNLNLGYG